MQAHKPIVAKVMLNARLDTLRVVFSFDLFNKITRKNTVFISSDICDAAHENAVELVRNVIRRHSRDLRANFVRVELANAALMRQSRLLELLPVVDL